MFKEVVIEQNGLKLEGHISYEQNPKAWVIFAHGSGSSRKSSRNNWVAQQLNQKGYATLLFDLLTSEEDLTYSNRFDIPLLAERLKLATKWLLRMAHYKNEPIAYFGASTGAGAALVAAAKAPEDWPLFTVISRGGRPDLAGQVHLKKVFSPVLLIVGSLDEQVISLNQQAANELKHADLKLVEGATHLFEEPGTLNQVVELCLDWLGCQLPARRQGELYDHP